MDSGKHSGRRSRAVLALISVLFAGVSLPAENSPAASKIVSSETGVLLLPALDATKDAANMLAPRRAVIRHREQAEFLKRQFKLLGEPLAVRAAEASPKIDLTRISDRTAENLDQLSRRAKADWAVSIIVEEVEMNPTDSGSLAANTRLHLQIWDARKKEWLINQVYTGTASGDGAPPMVFMKSLDQAVRTALSPQLQTFPLVVTLERENTLIDYLEGQTEAFVADAKTSFAGLRSGEHSVLR